MSGLALEEVRRIARLARLKLDATTEADLRQQLRAILDYAALLDEIDAADPALDDPCGGPDSGSGEAGLREDRPRPGLTRDEALDNAPDVADGHFRVPRVLS